jgi:hypothetical protein
MEQIYFLGESKNGHAYAWRRSLFGRFHLYDFLGTGHFTVSAFDAHLFFNRNIPILKGEIEF